MTEYEKIILLLKEGRPEYWKETEDCKKEEQKVIYVEINALNTDQQSIKPTEEKYNYSFISHGSYQDLG